MNTWAPLWSPIVDSSLWEEDGDVVKVFISMIATKDSDHICRLDAYRLAKKCHLDELRVLDIIKILASPDTRRKIPQEFDGRRIKAVEDGWLVLNGEKYRQMVQEERKKARNRKSQAAWRERQKNKTAPTGREQRAVEAYGAGENERGDAIALEGLPLTPIQKQLRAAKAGANGGAQ